MKKNFIFVLMSCFLATSALFISGCDDKDDPDNPTSSVPDPEGTILVSMRNGNNGGTTSITPDNCYHSFIIGKDDNFYGSNWKFVSIGKLKGLGNITKIPTSGWASQVAVIPEYGYVGASYGASSYRMAGTTYLRIYVMDYIESIGGGVIGADVKYQSPFHVKSEAKEITVSETVVNVSWKGGNPNTITFTPFNATWTVTSSTDWCRVDVTDLNSFYFWVLDNNGSSRSATLTIKMEGLPDKTITVTQAGRN